MNENEISYLIRGAVFNVYNELGPGLLESVYTEALKYELTSKKLRIDQEVPINVYYKTNKLGIGFRLDLLVNDQVIIEVKSTKILKDIHHKQTMTYLRLTGLKLAILINFNSKDISKDIFRKVNRL